MSLGEQGTVTAQRGEEVCTLCGAQLLQAALERSCDALEFELNQTRTEVWIEPSIGPHDLQEPGEDLRQPCMMQVGHELLNLLGLGEAVSLDECTHQPRHLAEREGAVVLAM